MPWVVKLLVTVWISFCVLRTAAASWFVIASGDGERWYFPLFGVCMLVAGGLVMKVGTWLGRHDVTWLSGVISKALSASIEASALNRAGS